VDLKDALQEEIEYAINYRGLKLFFTLRNPNSAEDLEFRRRSGKLKAKNGRLESSDEALNAPLWLLDKLKTKVEYSNGTPQRLDLSPEDYEKIPVRTKLSVIAKHLADLEGEEAELQNSK
jgi:hypothetical protein